MQKSGQSQIPLAEQHEQLRKQLQKAEQLHERGELHASLKEFKKALALASAKSEMETIQASMREIRELIAYVSDMEPSHVSLKEFMGHFFQENAIRIYALLIVSALVVLVALSLGPIQEIFSGAEPSLLPQASEHLNEDKVVLGDRNVRTNPDFGNRGGEVSPALVIKESDSRITITLPDQFLAPYPEKYLRQSTALLEEPRVGAARRLLLKANEKVSVRARSPDGQWLRVWSANSRSGWLPLSALMDEPRRSAAEIDREIFTQMGNKYWEIEIRGDQQPYAYFLHVNAPDAQRAGEALLAGYRAYAARQLVQLSNLQAQVKLLTYEVQAAKPQLSADGGTLTLVLTLFSINENQLRQQAGTQTLVIRKDARTGRFILTQPLEGA